MNAVRPDPTTKKCPNGTVPCSEKTPPDETICVTEEQKESQCPITFVQMVPDSEQVHNLLKEKNFGSDVMNMQIRNVPFNLLVYFSKTFFDKLPFVELISPTTNYPCFFDEQKHQEHYNY